MKITVGPSLDRSPRAGVGKRAATWLIGVAIGACLAVDSASAGTILCQETFDSDPGWVAGGGGAPWSATVFTSGQALLQYTNPATTDPDNIGPWLASFSPTDPAWKVTFQPNQPLELRTQVLNVNQNDAFAVLGVLSSDNNGYLVMVERNEVVLMKTATTPTGDVRSYFFWRLLSPTQMTNLTLAAAFSQVGADLSIRVRLLDAPSQTLLWQTNVVDTAGLDPVLPNRANRNLLMQPEQSPAPYVGIELTPCVGICYLNPLVLPTVPVEVTLDNVQVLQYPAPVAEIERDVRIFWPEGTVEEQIVVAANSLASNAVWTPWPEPIYKRFGQLSMAVPITRSEQYFRLVPGTQFIDNFSPTPQYPYLTRSNWVPGFYGSYSNRFEFAVTNGTYRIQATNNSSDSRVPIRPPGPYIVARDFTVSVDLLEGSSTGIGIGARVGGDPGNWPGYNRGYIGSLWLNDPGHLGQGRLSIYDGYNPHVDSYFNIDPAADYRLQFSGVGNLLAVKLFNVANPTVPVRQYNLTNSNFSQGFVALWIESNGPNTIVLDNFFVTGTTP